LLRKLSNARYGTVSVAGLVVAEPATLVKMALPSEPMAYPDSNPALMAVGVTPAGNVITMGTSELVVLP
jgi:hypothetical protein